MESINQIDRLTLELLTSRKQYRQYLKHTDTQKYLEQTGFIKKIRKHESAILEIIHGLLSDPEKPITNEITDTFIPFIQAIFKHLENIHTEYDDVLFDHCENDMTNSHSKNMIQYSMQMFMKPQTRFMQKQKERRFSNPENLGLENNMLNTYSNENEMDGNLEHRAIYSDTENDS